MTSTVQLRNLTSKSDSFVKEKQVEKEQANTTGNINTPKAQKSKFLNLLLFVISYYMLARRIVSHETCVGPNMKAKPNCCASH